MMPPFFSIIIPVYNVVPYLRECLDSVLAQTFTNWEAICVDDGSTDGSGIILDEYAARDSRFRVIHQPNAGVSAARNTGIDIAVGTWVVFLDSDDLLERDILRIMTCQAEANPELGLMRFEFNMFYDGSVWVPDYPTEIKVASIDISAELKPETYATLMWRWCYLRTRLSSCRFDVKMNSNEDVLFMCRYLLSSVDRYVDVHYPGIGYRQRRNSVVHSYPTVKTWISELKGRVELFKAAMGSKKRVVGLFSGNWANGFLAKAYICGIVQRPKVERALLYNEWLKAVDYIVTLKGIGLRYWIVYRICSLLRTYRVAWMLCYWIHECIVSRWIKTACRFILRRGEFSPGYSRSLMPKFCDGYSALELLRHDGG